MLVVLRGNSASGKTTVARLLQARLAGPVAGRYGPMLHRVAAASDDARFYAFDLTFEETVRRHATRPKVGDFSAEEMAAWYHGWQPLDIVAEHRITAAEPPEEVVERILLHA